MPSPAALVNRFAYEPEDVREVRSEKNAILLVALSCCAAGCLWAAMYAVIYGFAFTTSLPLIFVLVVGTSIVTSHVMKRLRIAVYAQINCIMWVTAAIQWSIGGVFDSGAVIVWGFLGPLVALMFLSIRASVVWFALYLGVVVATVAFDGFWSSRNEASSEALRLFYFGLNLSGASAVVFAFAGYFVKATIEERALANRLLLNVLPAKIAERLKQSNDAIAESYDSVSVLFVDAADSTPMFAELEPPEVVDWLNAVFTAFDEVVERHGLEKLRTIGDGYMVGSGVPERRADHAEALVACALDLIGGLDKVPSKRGKRLKFRFGINSGPVVAGVVGTSKFHYDLWGDAVNVASRMESTGEAGRLHISDATYELIKDAFECEERGLIAVKGKGEMRTWFVDRPRPVPLRA